jgi:septal ring factor EnvC (AmiA/AmiB activator)
VDLNKTKIEQSNALQNQSEQLQVLEEDKEEKNGVLNDLKDRETDISAEITKREKKQSELKNAINAAIKREVAEAAKREKERLAKAEGKIAAAAENPSPAATDVAANATAATTGVKGLDNTNRAYSSLESTPEGKELSIKFENNKRNIPWPVSGGYVTHDFGTQQLGPNLRENNIGISIGVKIGTSVKCVADGEVSKVIDMTDGSYAVIVMHGKYFTTYSNLSSANVGVGDKVKAGTILGKAGINLESNGEITFIVANDKGDYLDPKGWLK